MIAKINVLLARISIGDLHKRMIVDCSFPRKRHTKKRRRPWMRAFQSWNTS